ncbi:MAG: RnfABCDGE type electron transport complex subunit D [Bacteroidales bacterium]|nr:RnfABCDGE type electron transport complex subunit D [Bacteroidales bacterium]
MSNLLTVSPSPHAKGKETVSGLMYGVLIALVPAFLCSLWFFGIGALMTTLLSVLFCVATEWAVTKFILKQTPHITDGSAIVTGVLLAFNLPSNINPGIILVGAIVAIGVAKLTFGGLGNNPFNPALVARVFLLISFGEQMTGKWPLPIESRTSWLDAVTGATPLSHDMLGKVELSDMLFGGVSGSLGEVAALALIIGGIYMIWRKIITWHIPVAIIATVLVFTSIVYVCDPENAVNPLYHILGGGLLLGAIFMATDYVTSPMSDSGKIIYGIGIGLITVLIRNWGGYPEGMSFAILLMNALVPIINKKFKPKRFGEVKIK